MHKEGAEDFVDEQTMTTKVLRDKGETKGRRRNDSLGALVPRRGGVKGDVMTGVLFVTKQRENYKHAQWRVRMWNPYPQQTCGQA